MTLRQALSRAGLALLLLASLAMSATAFAHRTTPSDPDLLAYLSMGGTLEDLCGEDGPAHHLSTGCEACRISANALAPATTPGVAAPMRFAKAAPLIAPGLVPTGWHSDVTPPSRAPPRG